MVWDSEWEVLSGFGYGILPILPSGGNTARRLSSTGKAVFRNTYVL
jgi:hypothetical protein